MPRFLYLLRKGADCGGAMSPEEMQNLIQTYMAWIETLKPGGHLLAAEKLEDGEGRVIQKKGILKDGPFSEAKEVVGGFWIIEADDYDHAIKLSEGLPYGDENNLEIRRIHEN